MEETINKLKVTYIGNIGNQAYFNIEYIDEFKETTELKVLEEITDLKALKELDETSHTVDFELVKDVTKYSDHTIRTLIIKNSNPSELNKYTIQVFENDEKVPVEEVTVTNDSNDLPALIEENVHVRAIGDRIIEVLFDEPVENLEASFDFGNDQFNLKTPIALTDKGHLIFGDVDNSGDITGYFFKNSAGIRLKVEDSGNETDTSYTLVGKEVLQFLNTAEAKKIVPLSADKYSSLQFIEDGIASGASNQSCYVMFMNPYSKDIQSNSSVLMNYYFRYFGTDDEGTLYEPTDKPFDWLGYFASKDITTTVSADNRKVEIQFDNYSLPTTTSSKNHELIINYAKTFTDYSTSAGDFRITDPAENPFPIVNKEVTVKKIARKAVVTEVIALSKDEILVTYDKPVLCQNNAPYSMVIDGDKIPVVSRFNNSYNTLLCQLDSSNPLETGDAVTIKIGSIIDACGYKTPEYTTTIEVVAVPPEVDSLEQTSLGIEDEDKETRFLVTFTDPMASYLGDVSEYFTIYKVEGDTTEKLEGFSITSVNAPANKPALEENELLISVEPALEPGGLYEIHISGLTNTYGTVMLDYVDRLYIKDMSEPYIKAIYLTDNTAYAENEQYKIAILFNETMQRQGLHGIENCENYLIHTPKDVTTLGTTSLQQCNGTSNKTPLSTKNCLSATSIKNNKAVRLVLNQEEIPKIDDNKTTPGTIEFKPEHIIVKPGYCMLDEIKYLVNTAGNILDFVCPTEEVLSEPINLSTADFKVESNQVVITYKTQNNEVLNANKSAFTLSDGTTPQKVTLGLINSIVDNPTRINKQGTITVTFPSGSFDDPGQTLTIDNTCEDIFGNKINGVSNIDLDYKPVPRLTNAYFAAKHANRILFALQFNEEVKLKNPEQILLAARDYSVTVNNEYTAPAIGIGRLLGEDQIGNSTSGPLYVGPLKAYSTKTLYLEFENLDGENFKDTDKFSIKVNVPYNEFKTLDATSGNPVEIFSERQITEKLPPLNESLKCSDFVITDTTLKFTISSVSGKPLDMLNKDKMSLTTEFKQNSTTTLKENDLFKYVEFKGETLPTLNAEALSIENKDGKLDITFTFTNAPTDVTDVEFDLRDALITMGGIPVENEEFSIKELKLAISKAKLDTDNKTLTFSVGSISGNLLDSIADAPDLTYTGTVGATTTLTTDADTPLFKKISLTGTEDFVETTGNKLSYKYNNGVLDVTLVLQEEYNGKIKDIALTLDRALITIDGVAFEDVDDVEITAAETLKATKFTLSADNILTFDVATVSGNPLDDLSTTASEDIRVTTASTTIPDQLTLTPVSTNLFSSIVLEGTVVQLSDSAPVIVTLNYEIVNGILKVSLDFTDTSIDNNVDPSAINEVTLNLNENVLTVNGLALVSNDPIISEK